MFPKLAPLVLALCALAFFPQYLTANTISLGILSVDFAPSPIAPAPGSSDTFATFDILNGTGTNDSTFPDMTFPVATPLTFTGFTMTLFLQGGGNRVFTPLQFTPDGSGGFAMNAPIDLTASPILNATLTGTFSPGTPTLNDGSTMVLSPQFGAILMPSSGTTLQLNDLAVVNATPEPRSWMLMGTGLAALCLLRGVRLRRLVKTAAAVSAVVLVLSGSAYAQVKLNAATQPATVVAGNTAYLTGSGFPAGTIAPGQVTIALAGTCLGTPVSTAAAASVTNVIGTSKRISFVAPLSVSSGVYYVSIAGTASSGAFASNNCSTTTVQNTSNFVSAGAGSFWLHGSPFRFGGTNIYSPMYSNRAGVDALLGTAHAAQQNVVRTWTWIDIGGNGTPSIKNAQNGFYFQYWPVNGAAPAYNDGTNGLQNLDYTIYRAGQLGMKLIMAFTNNWNDFGGMDQYVAWRGFTHHSDFYTDATIRQWYKDWIGHLLNRVNTLTGIPYKDDPTIMMWELANEPRCGGSDGTHYPAASTCNPQTLVSWVQDVASYVKTVDPLHLLAVGDEGFYCKDPKSSDWTMNCTQGGDTVGFAQAPAIDAMSMHLYPDSWSKNLAWSQTWITQHLTDAAGIGKPAYLGEYGWSTQNTRLPVYFNWSNAVLANGGLAALQWDIIPGSPAPAYSDPTGFDLYAGSPELLLLNNFSQMMAAGQTLTFPPVAGNQSSTTAFNTPIVLNPMQNDVAYGNATINPLSVDLDPNTPGQQTSVTTGLGTFAAQVDGTVLYTPAATYSGPALATYTVKDTNGATSNVASLVVTVGANPNATQLTMFSFEDGTADGWGPVNSASNGAVQATTAFHTDGIDGLQLNVAATDWFGATLTSNANLSSTGKFHSSLQVDVQTLSTGTSVNLQFTAGSSSNWCQGNSATVSPSFIPANTTATVTLDLTNLSALTCFGGTLTDTNMRTVKAVHLLLNPGTYNLDYFRAQ